MLTVLLSLLSSRRLASHSRNGFVCLSELVTGMLDLTPLGPRVLVIAGSFALFATVISFIGIYMHLRNYRRPDLQRLIVRILLMVPVYALESWISLCFHQAAPYLDATRDCYEAFVVYTFFTLLVNYLGGERVILQRPDYQTPVSHIWPLSLFYPKMNLGRSSTFLWIKRGILQFVVLKPVLAIVTMYLQFHDLYEEGNFDVAQGYVWIQIIYNLSVGISMYCLIVFYLGNQTPLEPFRPVPKFLSVKAVVFFSFWQNGVIVLAVKFGLIKSGKSHDVVELFRCLLIGIDENFTAENIAAAVQEFLICFEMLLASIVHLYAFEHTDFSEMTTCRVPFLQSTRDVLSFHDVVQDTYQTFLSQSASGEAHPIPSGNMSGVDPAPLSSNNTSRQSTPEPGQHQPLIPRHVERSTSS